MIDENLPIKSQLTEDYRLMHKINLQQVRDEVLFTNALVSIMIFKILSEFSMDSKILLYF